MSPTLLEQLIERPSILGPEPVDRADRTPRFERSDGGVQTVEDLIRSAWEGLHDHRTATCPVCTAAMTPRYGAGPGPVAATCGSCGTELS